MGRAFIFLAMCFFASGVQAATQLASHEAVYDVAIEDQRSTSSVRSVLGRTSFAMQRQCDGWRAVEDYAIFFYFEKDESNYLSRFESWESTEGDAFSFTLYEHSTRDGEERYTGFANTSANKAEAHFIDGDGEVMSLPAETVFPIGYIRKVLRAAHDGKKQISAPLFTGGDYEDALHFVSTFIGRRQTADAEELSQELLGGLAEDGYWPVRFAYFVPDSDEAVADYEIEFNLQDNGVIRSYLIDYGAFSMRGILQDAKALAEPIC